MNCKSQQLHDVKGKNEKEKNEKVRNEKKKNEKEKKRIWELDFFRGIALILMIYFHVIFDMKDIFGYGVDYSKGFNRFTGRAAGILFIAISGISCTLSRNNIKRALKILGLAIGITVVTHLYSADMGIKFGVLHFLGFSILLYPLLAKLDKYLLAVIGTVILIAGQYISNINPSFDYFFMLGIRSERFVSADYYPVIPWIGVFIYGIIFGKVFYKDKKSIFSRSIFCRSIFSSGEAGNDDSRISSDDSKIDSAASDIGSSDRVRSRAAHLRSGTGNVLGSVIRIISWMGRNTLIIYIIHQLVILLVITLVRKALGQE